MASGDPGKGCAVGDFKIILTHNLTAAFRTMCGSLILALPALGFVAKMGFVNGGALVVACKNYSLFYWFLSTVPHSVIEFPAFLLCSTFSLRLGLRWLFQKHGSDRKRVFLSDLANACKTGLLCIPMFFVAAALESFVTPRIVDLFYEEVQPGASGDAGFSPSAYSCSSTGAPIIALGGTERMKRLRSLLDRYDRLLIVVVVALAAVLLVWEHSLRLYPPLLLFALGILVSAWRREGFFLARTAAILVTAAYAATGFPVSVPGMLPSGRLWTTMLTWGCGGMALFLGLIAAVFGILARSSDPGDNERLLPP